MAIAQAALAKPTNHSGKGGSAKASNAYTSGTQGDAQQHIEFVVELNPDLQKQGRKNEEPTEGEKLC